MAVIECDDVSIRYITGDFKSIGLKEYVMRKLTNNFHVTRAAALARKQGLTNVYAIAAPSDPAYLPNNMFREFFGLTKDFLAGNL